jgi:hypothetical protein
MLFRMRILVYKSYKSNSVHYHIIITEIQSYKTFIYSGTKALQT